MSIVTSKVIGAQRDYHQLIGFWEQFTKHVSEYFAEASVKRDLPSPSVDKKTNSIEICLAGIRIVCQLRYLGKHSELQFGYVLPQSDPEKIEVTNSIVVDKLGNIINESTGVPTDCHLTYGDAVELVYLAGCLEVLEQAEELLRFGKIRQASSHEENESSWEPDVV
jgi:hypothetical protein